jgi:hypothetical protein
LLKNVPGEVRVAVTQAPGRVQAAEFLDKWARANNRSDVLADIDGASHFIADARGIKFETVLPVVRKIFAGETIDWSKPAHPAPQPGAEVPKDVESTSVTLMAMPGPEQQAAFIPPDDAVVGESGENGNGNGKAAPIDITSLIPTEP